MLLLNDGDVRFSLAIEGPTARVEARTGWLSAGFDAPVDEDEPRLWAADLATLLAAGAGAATLRPRHGWMETTFAMAKKDELHVSVHLQNAPDYLHEVRLFLNLRQSELAEIAAGCQEMRGERG